MGSRYIVTGTQLGILKGLSKVLKDIRIKNNISNDSFISISESINKTLDEILSKQYIGHSNRDIIDDRKKINQQVRWITRHDE